MGYTNNTAGEALSEKHAKFLPRAITATPGARNAIESDKAAELLARHFCGDWGDCCEEDRKVNDSALANGQRLMSVYKSPDHETIWIITEWDRSITTVLLPEEY